MSSEEVQGSTRITDVVRGPLGPDGKSQGESLIVIYTKEPSLLGKRFMLDSSPTRLGRGIDNHIILDGDSVSRRHMYFEKRGEAWWAIDEGSTNGTYVNDEQIAKDVILASGDRLKIGATILKYLSGSTVEAQYHEEIHRLMIIDGLTQLHVKRYLLQNLAREFSRSRRQGSALSALIIDIDHFHLLNKTHGDLAGDYVLKQIGQLLRENIPEPTSVARYGGEEFATVLDGTTLDDARALGERIRSRIEAYVFTFQGETIRLTVSVGGATLHPDDQSGDDVLKRAAYALYVAKREGRNRVVCDPDIEYRPVLDGTAIVQKMRTRGEENGLLAFEMEGETAIVEQLGVHVFEDWLRQLIRAVELNTENAALIATWRDRQVFAAVPPSVVDNVVNRVTTDWRERGIPTEQRAVERRLRHAYLPPDDVVRLGDRALAVVGGRLLQPATLGVVPNDVLPFPIATLRSMVLMRRTTVGRVMGLLDGVEVALRFASAIELALLGECDGEVREQTAEILVAHEETRLPWEIAGLKVAPLVKRSCGEPFSTVIESLVAITHDESLVSTANDTGRLRDLIAEEVGISEDAHASEEVRLRRLLDALVAAFQPLAECRLVSVAEIETVDEEDEGYGYALRVHRGSGEQFPIVSERVTGRLLKNWCYLLPKAGVASPLSLAPLVASRTCDECGRIEVSIAETLVWDEKGSIVNLRGVTNKHRTVAELPGSSRGTASLRSSVLGVRLRRSLEAPRDNAASKTIAVESTPGLASHFSPGRDGEVTGQFTVDRSLWVTGGGVPADDAPTSAFEFDVAISFAGEDRGLANALASRLKSLKTTVFYDEDEQAQLWGKDLYAHLHDLYSRRARYCIMLVSRHYAKKQWTTVERRAAQERALRETDQAYILPVRIDDAEVPGLANTIGYVSAKLGVDKICQLVRKKLAGA